MIQSPVASSLRAVVRNAARSVPASGSEYPIAKWIVPSRIPGRNFSFCFSVPYFCRVGPTVCSVTEGSGTSARVASLVKICCSMWPKPLPPYSVGQPTPSQPSRPIRLMISA